MNSQQENIVYGLMGKLEETIDKWPLIGNYSIVKKDVAMDLLDKLYAAFPDEVKKANELLRRKDELQYEAQQKAERIVADAQGEANRLLSESDILRAVQREAEKIKEQVISDCEEIKRKAVEEADALRAQAYEDAEKTKNGASAYAEQLLANLEQNLAQMQEIVKNGQITLEKRRMESEQIGHNYVNQRSDYAQDFVMR